MRAIGRRRADGGQALVEFSLVIVIFLVLMMAIVDLGRGIYMFNGVAESAREIARVTSVHPGTGFGNSAQTAAVLSTQKGLVPSLGNPSFACVDIDDSAVALVNGKCPAGKGYRVKVTIAAPYSPVTPILGLTGTWNMRSTSSMELP
ncbi:MAG: TadE/TadG family type IV pilus assembly protein [Chloroflexota bacterium]